MIYAFSQIEFFAKKVEEYEGQKTLSGIHEWKIAELEAKCDKIRAENNVCNLTMLLMCTAISYYLKVR